MRASVWIAVALVVAQFAVGFYLYPRMPEEVAIHWGLSGEADGYGSRFIGLFMVPIMSGLMLPFMLALPRLDPAGGIREFQGSYEWFVAGFTAFMAYLHGLTLAWNLGWRLDMMRMLAPTLGALFYGIGAMMGSARYNWFVGVRTPWTLSSEEVWERTHRLGGRMFKACGVAALLGTLAWGWLALLHTVAPVLAAGIYLTYYSYAEYRKSEAKGTSAIPAG